MTRVVFLGSDDFSVPTLEKLTQSFEIPLVVTTPDGQHRRKKTPVPTPVKEVSNRLGLECHQPPKLKNSPKAIDLIRDANPDVCVVVSYGRFLPDELLALPPHGCINLHPSLLPAYRGPGPIPRAVLAGDSETGLTVIRLTSEMDAGPILAQETVSIEPGERAGDLRARLAQQGAHQIVRTIEGLVDGTIEPREQNHDQATYAAKLKKSEGLIDWSNGPEDIDRHIRGMDPWPGAFTWLHRPDQPPMRIEIMSLGEPQTPPAVIVAPGTIADTNGSGILVHSLNMLVQVTEVRPAGKKTMAAGDFIRGRGIETGDRFGPEEFQP